MRRRHSSLVVVLLGLLLALVACFPLDRASTLLPGTVRGQARFSGEGRADVGVTLSNTRFAQNSGDDGDFLIAGLGAGTHGLRLQEDDDGDGVVDRGAAVGFAITNDAKDVVGVDLGPVAMHGTVTVSGTITDPDGLGLDDLVVVVSRFGLDKTAEVYVPLTDDDGDGVVEYSLRGVVPGAIEVQAFAGNGRASPARSIELSDESDEPGVDLDVVEADLVPISTNVSPALSTARFALVAVDAGPNATPIAGDRVGRVLDVAAGVYDVWFFAGDANDRTPIAVLPRQVARPFETPADDDTPRALQWGPALRGAVSGIDGTENTLPTIEAPAEQRVLAAMTGGATRIPLTIVDPDGDDIALTAVPPPAGIPIEIVIDGTDVVVTYTGGADPGAALFSRTPILVEADDGRGVVVHEVGVAVIADGIFVGPGTLLGDATNWLDGVVASGPTSNVVIESPVVDQSSVFAALDLRSTFDVLDELQVNRIFSTNGDGIAQGGGLVRITGNAAAPGLFVGRAHDVNVRISGVGELRDLIVLQSDGVEDGTFVLVVESGSTLQQTGASGAVDVQIPLSAEGDSTVRFTDGATVHFTKDVQLLGTIDIDDSSGIALGYDTIQSTIALTAFDTLELGTLSVAGKDASVFTINAPIRATRELRIIGDARVVSQREQLEVGNLVMTTADGSLAAIAITVGIDDDGGNDAPRVINGLVESRVTVVGDVAIAGDLVVLSADADGNLEGAVDVEAGAALRFGAGARLRTKFLGVEGTLDLGGAGRLELIGTDDAMLFGLGAVVDSREPHAHVLRFDPASDDDVVLFYDNVDATAAFDVVDVASSRFLVRRGDVTVRELILGAGASADVDTDNTPAPTLTVGTCSGPGTAPVCPSP